MHRVDFQRFEVRTSEVSDPCAAGPAWVYLLERDLRISEHISGVLKRAGYEVKMVDTLGSVAAAYNDSTKIACSILDYRLGESLGYGRESGKPDFGSTPLILLGEAASSRTVVKAIRAGAFDFLTKPIDDAELVEAVESAIQEAERRWSDIGLQTRLRKNNDRLTPREREDFTYVVQGFPNKQTANVLGTSEVTIRIHRGQIMRKMAAKSLGHLLKSAVLIGVA